MKASVAVIKPFKPSQIGYGKHFDPQGAGRIRAGETDAAAS
jgi:hypothetical protein